MPGEIRELTAGPYSVGDQVTVEYRTTNAAGQPTAATVAIEVAGPAAEAPVVAPVNTGVGVNTFTWTLTSAGLWTYVCSASVAVVDITEGALEALARKYVPAWSPTPEQVHGLIPARPVFTDTSRPTRREVLGIIGQTVQALRAELGDTMPLRYYGKARLVATLHAAAQVESGFFPEQGLGDEGPYERLYGRYKDELLGLRTMLGDADGSGPGSAFTAASPVQQAVNRLYPPAVV